MERAALMMMQRVLLIGVVAPLATPTLAQTPRTATSIVSIQQLRVPSKANSELDRSRKSYLKGDLLDARNHVSRALQIYPHYANALAWRGIIASDDPRQLQNACLDVEAAIQYDPGLPLAYAALGMLYNRMGRWSDAQKILQTAIALDPTLWQAHYEAARAAQAQHNPQLALAHAERALALTPGELDKIAALKATISSMHDALGSERLRQHQGKEITDTEQEDKI